MSSVKGPHTQRTGPRRSPREKLIEDLTALVAALDRRVPQIERAGELQIAHDAKALRAEAIERLALLRGTAPTP